MFKKFFKREKKTIEIKGEVFTEGTWEYDFLMRIFEEEAKLKEKENKEE